MLEVKSQDGRARAGIFRVRTGTLETPFFMPVITRSNLTRFGIEDYYRLGADSAECRFSGTSAAICNSLIASFTPGVETIVDAGGVHELLEFRRPLFTDSGGYQVSPGSSFASRLDYTGITFAANWRDSEILLTPRESMRIQQLMGSDVAMVLDDMGGANPSRQRQLLALERTHRWAESCLLHHSDSHQLLMGICQGGSYEDLRSQSAAHINSLGFPGVAIGGIAMLPDRGLKIRSVRAALREIHADKLRYVMGVGHPVDILEMVAEGIDCFDAAFPTIQAQRGVWLSDRGMFTRKDPPPQSPSADEGPGSPAAHNLHFMEKFMREVRAAIADQRFGEYHDAFLAQWTDVPDAEPTVGAG
jgi:queuine tRNA-ribosyltransferase